MEGKTRSFLFWLVPIIVLAALVLGYFAVRSAQTLARMSEQSVAQSTLILVDEKVDRVEQQIISADEAAFHLVDLAHPESMESTWSSLAERISPTIREMLVLDENLAILAHACRCSDQDRETSRKFFFERILPDLGIAGSGSSDGRLHHLHKTYGDSSQLTSFKHVTQDDQRFYLIARHDIGYIVRRVLPQLFATDQNTNGLYNVVDENNHRVFGPSIAGAGDYVVGRRFPTTLYDWRLQIAPEQAPLLRTSSEVRVRTEIAVLALAFGTIVIGVGVLIFAAVKENRLNRLRSEFVANVSHELKTPLSVVRMYGELLMTGRVKDETRRAHYLETIVRESERLSALIENVLDFSAIERGRNVYAFKDGDILETIQRAQESFRYRFEKDEAPLVRLVVSGDIPRIQFDDQAIHLTVLNLLDNAAKYGRSDIELTIERGKRHVYLHVRDHGPGIAEEHQKRVFDRFFRIRDGNTAVRGSGIGLALVKHIVEAHRGKVWVENAEGGGAQFSFSLPMEVGVR